MRLEPFRQCRGILAVGFHSQMQGFKPSQCQETVERPLDCTGGVLQERHTFRKFAIVTDHKHAADDV